ncbi:major facilitator superfamily domain-containing protein [Pavlovales sp. CCMP2436]|nr:major facilitator superfamily domain-containing protein [Pavlovales sp. CCMP2436]
MSQPEQTTLLHEIFTALPGILPIFIDLLGVSVVLPLLPVYVNSLGESATWVGAVLAGQFIGQAIGTPLMGAFADRYGPKKALLAAMIGNGVFFIISAFEMPMIALVFVRLFGALSNATGGGQKWIIDASSPKHRDVMLTLPMAAVLLGFLVGAAIGGVTGSWSLSCYITAGECCCPATCCSLPAARRLLPAASCLLPAACSPLPAARFLACCPLLASRCPLPATPPLIQPASLREFLSIFVRG